MIPIPVPIIRTKRLYIPLLYVLATVVLCHFFITALGTSTQVSLNNLFTNLSPNETTSVSVKLNVKESNPRVHRSLEKSNNENDSRRSNSTKIWIGHQDERIRMEIEENQVQKWIGDPECENYKIRFAEEHTFKPRALVSFPGSGNSWLRHLIESSTGIFTGSIYNDKFLFRGGFLGELRPPNDGRTILQKTHHFSTINASREKLQAYVKLSELMFGYRGILLIRNPYEALLSFWNLQTTRNHTGQVDRSSFSTIAWKLFVEKAAKSWADLIRDWVEKSMDLHVVQYEELKKQPEKEILQILKYLNQPIDQKRVKCTIKHIEGSFHRKNRKSEVTPLEESYSHPFIGNMDLSGNFTLDLIVQNNIKNINAFFLEYGFPLQLNYKLPNDKRFY